MIFFLSFQNALVKIACAITGDDGDGSFPFESLLLCPIQAASV